MRESSSVNKTSDPVSMKLVDLLSINVVVIIAVADVVTVIVTVYSNPTVSIQLGSNRDRNTSSSFFRHFVLRSRQQITTIIHILSLAMGQQLSAIEMENEKERKKREGRESKERQGERDRERE